MNFNFLDDMKNIKCENMFFCQFIESLESLLEKVDTKLKENNPLSNEKEDKGELYYVYAYTPEKVHITKQGSNKLESLDEDNIMTEYEKRFYNLGVNINKLEAIKKD